VIDDDPDEYGYVYTLTAMESNTKLFISHHEGGRSTDDATELFNDLESKRSNTSPIPLFTSDDRDPFKLGLPNVYGSLDQPPYCGIGRISLPILVPPEYLKYAQVCKKVANGHVIEVLQRVVFGDIDEVLRLFGPDSGGCINTSYIERVNLTIRNSLARFIRKGMNYSKDALMHSRAIDFFQGWYNFVKTHKSLRLDVNCGNKRWLQRTPAMAQKLTDHIWTLEELLTFRIPVQ
jgi:IS1 family transposase